MKKLIDTLFFIFLIICCSFAFGKESKTKDMEVYLKDLISSRIKINGYNYQQIVYQKVCPYMRGLKDIESAQKINGDIRQKILQEVVKIYDKAFDFSVDHSLIFCVYNYYSATKLKNPSEFFKIALKIVSPKKLRLLKDKFNTCDRVDKEGNGDGVNIPLKKTSYLIPKKQYQIMSPSLRLRYIKEIKKAFLHFEIDIKNQRQQKKTAWLNFLNFFIPPAFSAVVFSEPCLIGGNLNETVFSEYLKRDICPSRDNHCDGSENKFECGFIFNHKCIPIDPNDSISERCYNASKNTPIDRKDYIVARDKPFHYFCHSRLERESCLF